MWKSFWWVSFKLTEARCTVTKRPRWGNVSICGCSITLKFKYLRYCCMNRHCLKLCQILLQILLQLEYLPIKYQLKGSISITNTFNPPNKRAENLIIFLLNTGQFLVSPQYIAAITLCIIPWYRTDLNFIPKHRNMNYLCVKIQITQ